MIENDDERAPRWEGHRYETPESEATRASKEWAYAALGLVFVLLMALIVTGKVQIWG